MKFVDHSHTNEQKKPLFSPETPKPTIRAWMSHEKAAASGSIQGCSCEISEVAFTSSIGTYIDSSCHFDPAGVTIDEIELEQLILPGIAIDCSPVSKRQAIHSDVLIKCGYHK